MSIALLVGDPQVPVHAGDADIPKAKYKCPQCLIQYCSLACFKIHKDHCVPKPPEATPETPSGPPPKAGNEGSTGSPPAKVEKEYALLAPSQLSLLWKDADIVKQMNSPTLKVLFRNLLANIPADADLTEINTETAAPLESALSVMQEVRETESGQAVAELEALIERIHKVSREYR